MSESAAVDVHQHVWPEGFIEQLRRRVRPPFLAGWTLHLAGEAPYPVRPADHDPVARAALDPDLARIVLSLSSPLGVEYLPPDEAAPLLAAWHDGVRDLPGPYLGWASVSVHDPDLDELGKRLADGLVGVQIPAGALATPAALERVAPVLAVAEAAGRPAFVHPGPVACAGLPGWWPAVVDYVAQLQAAWWTWELAGRALLPDLRICFAAAAGLAPLHLERFAARGGGAMSFDPNCFLDTSSYGRLGLDTVIRVLGIDAVVLGSDRPYAEPTDPGLGTAASHALRVANPHRLLKGARP